MRRMAFFDLREEELFIYIMERSGNTYRLKDIISSHVREGYLFDIGRTFEDIEESFLSLPLSLLSFRILELPFSDMEKIRDVLPFELDGLILGGSERIVFDLHPLGETNGKYKTLVIYLMKDTLGMILDRFKTAKVDPRMVTSIELASVYDSFGSEEEIPNLLLNPKPIADENRMDVAIKEIAHPTLNLRRGEFSYTVDSEKTKRSLKLTAILVACLGLVFLSDTTLKSLSTKRGISSVKDEMRKTYLGVFPNEKRITNELYQMKAHLKELKEKERLFIGISPLHFLLDLTSVSEPGTSFTEITIDKERIVLKGECPSLSHVQRVKKSLERFLMDVNISDTKAFSQDRTLFTITAKGRKA